MKKPKLKLKLALDIVVPHVRWSLRGVDMSFYKLDMASVNSDGGRQRGYGNSTTR